MERASYFSIPLALLAWLAGATTGFSQSPIDQGHVIVKAATAKVMAGANVVGEVRNGQRLPFTQRKGDWYLVEFQQQDGRSRRGWVHGDSLRVETVPDLPRPDESTQQLTIPGWGAVVDPLGDCRIVERASDVSFAVPGKYRDLVSLPKWRNWDAPRIVTHVQGDFIAQVLVRRFPVPFPKTAANPDNPYSYVSGGLLVWHDRDTFLRLQRSANGDSGKIGIHASIFSAGNAIANSFFKTADADIHLRVERKAGRFTQSYSMDGKTWTTIRPQGKELFLDDAGQVGVFVVNATTREITHEFTGFKVTTR